MPPADHRPTNSDQREAWNEGIGRTWAALHERLDKQIAPIGRAAMAKAALKPGERVLDIGCGCGETSLELAQAVGPHGGVLGVDISRPLVDIAREAGRGVSQLRFEVGDAQTEAFMPGSFDVLFSRFGVMFFEDPAAAFVNLRKALKPGGRLAFACWRNPAENLWMTLPMQAAADLLPPNPEAGPPNPNAPGPFAFANPDRLRGILGDAGFKDVTLDKFDAKTGADTIEDSVDLALKMGPLGAMLREMDAPDELKAKVRERIQVALKPFTQEDGVIRVPAAAWIVSAKN